MARTVYRTPAVAEGFSPNWQRSPGDWVLQRTPLTNNEIATGFFPTILPANRHLVWVSELNKPKGLRALFRSGSQPDRNLESEFARQALFPIPFRCASCDWEGTGEDLNIDDDAEVAIVERASEAIDRLSSGYAPTTSESTAFFSAITASPWKSVSDMAVLRGALGKAAEVLTEEGYHQWRAGAAELLADAAAHGLRLEPWGMPQTPYQRFIGFYRTELWQESVDLMVAGNDDRELAIYRTPLVKGDSAGRRNLDLEEVCSSPNGWFLGCPKCSSQALPDVSVDPEFIARMWLARGRPPLAGPFYSFLWRARDVRDLKSDLNLLQSPIELAFLGQQLWPTLSLFLRDARTAHSIEVHERRPMAEQLKVWGSPVL